MAKFGTFLSVSNPANGLPQNGEGLVLLALTDTVTDMGQLTASQIKTLNKAVKDGVLDKGKGGVFPIKKTVWAIKGFNFDYQRKRALQELSYLQSLRKNPIEHWIVDEDTNRIYLTLKTADRSKAETIASDLNKKAKRERYIVRGFGVENPANSHSEILNDYELEHDVKLPKSLKTKIGKIMERETNAQRKSGLDLMALKAFPSSHIQKAIIEVRKTVLK